MCGRFVQLSLFPQLKEEFRLEGSGIQLRPSWNIAPTQEIPVIVNDDPGRLIPCRWGLIPPWSKDPSIGNRLINARAETLKEKQSFRIPFRRHRCLVPADGFYEWKKDPEGNVPFYVTMKDGRPFGFAGLYSDWIDPGGKTIRTFTIITTGPNRLVAAIHDRMPAIVLRKNRDLWLDPRVQDPDSLAPLLAPYPSEEMSAWEVSRKVNSPGNNSPENIKRAKSST